MIWKRVTFTDTDIYLEWVTFIHTRYRHEIIDMSQMRVTLRDTDIYPKWSYFQSYWHLLCHSTETRTVQVIWKRVTFMDTEIYLEWVTFIHTRYRNETKGLFGEIMPSALLANASLGLLCHFATSFLQCHFDLQNHSHFLFQSHHRHRPHSCPCRQQ